MSAPQQQLLSTRLAALDKDISKVQRAVEEAQHRGQQIQEVHRLIGGRGRESVMNPLSEVNGTINRLQRLLRGDPDLHFDVRQSIPDIDEVLRSSLANLEIVWDRINEAKKPLRRIQSTMVRLDSRCRALQQSLSEGCGELREEVRTLQRRVDGTPDLGKEALRVLWKEYEDLLRKQARPLFGEYVDFLGGLTLRDTALEDRVCEMIDVLLEGLVDNALTVPTRGWALSNAMNSVVKVGFPEWTVWGIPLVAHEVGLGFARSAEPDSQIHRMLEEHAQQGWTVPQLRVLFADAFAAYMMGPAYACAIILLRLQPHHHDSDSSDEPSDVDRARLVLSIVGRLVRGESYFEMVNTLDRLWGGAVVNLAPVGEAEEAREAVEGTSPEDQYLRNFPGVVFGWLEQQSWIKKFDAERWSATEGWRRLLLANPLDTGAAVVADESDAVLVLLNAAWRARLDSPESAEQIAGHVRAFWENRPSGAGRRDDRRGAGPDYASVGER